MTQEQLAEAIGVTVGAVYKWENGRSAPEINLLIELADLFETSVDVLLGYEVRNNDREHIVERLKAYVHDREAADAVKEAEKALKKYPNNFEIVYQSARLFDVKGTEKKDENLLHRALELFSHACLLIDQNTDETVSALFLQVQMAEIYSQLGKPQKAVEILKKNNPCRMNSALIGDILASGCDRPKDAVPYLSEALLDCVVSQIRITMGYFNVFVKRKDYRSAAEILQWALGSFQSLKLPQRTNFLEKTEAMYLLICGDMYLRLGWREVAGDYLRRAKMLAQKFDADPSYAAEHIRFVALEEKSSGHDNLGVTAMEALRHYIEEEADTALIVLWEEIMHETE